MKTINKISIASAALAVLGLFVLPLRGDEGRHSALRWKKIVIDVACDARTLVINNVSPTDTEPKRGATFIVNGKIVPGGTIAAGNGLDIDTLTGSLGTWVCRGTFNFALSQIQSGSVPGHSTTQHYLFSPTGGLATDDSLMSEGQETGITTHRVVMGGTGMFRGNIGEVKQEILGVNNTGLFNFRFTFMVRSSDSADE
jgi:hypothetical protein